MRKNSNFQIIEVQGNNGGDYFKLIKEQDNQVIIEIGHCCVITVRRKIPIELLTVLLTRLEEQDEFEKVIENSDWEISYKERLRKQIVKLTWDGEVIK